MKNKLLTLFLPLFFCTMLLALLPLFLPPFVNIPITFAFTPSLPANFQNLNRGADSFSSTLAHKIPPNFLATKKKLLSKAEISIDEFTNTRFFLKLAAFPFSEPTEAQRQVQLEEILTARSRLANKENFAKISRGHLKEVDAIGYSLDYQKMLGTINHYNAKGLLYRKDLVLYSALTQSSTTTVSRDEISYRNNLARIANQHEIMLSVKPLSERVVSKDFSSEILGFKTIFSYQLQQGNTSSRLRLDFDTIKRRYIAAILHVSGNFDQNSPKIFLHRIHAANFDLSASPGSNTIALFVFRIHREIDSLETVDEIGVFLKPETIILDESRLVFRRNDFQLSSLQKLQTFLTETVIDPPSTTQTITYKLSGKKTIRLVN